MMAMHSQDDFAGAEIRGSFHVFEKSVDLSVEPDGEESSEASLEVYDEMPEEAALEVRQPLPKKKSKRRHARPSMEASELGGFWEYKQDSLDDPDEPFEEDPARRVNLQDPNSTGEENQTLATHAQSCFPAEPGTPNKQQKRPTTPDTDWDSVLVQNSTGSFPPLGEGEGTVQRDWSGEAGKAHDEGVRLHKYDKKYGFDHSNGSNIDNSHNGAGGAAESQRQLPHKPSNSDSDFQVTPLLAPVAEILQQQECFVQFHADNSECPENVEDYDKAYLDGAVEEQGEGSQDEPVSKYRLKYEDKGLSAAEADRADYDADLALYDEQEKKALESDASQLQQVENNETFFFADESLGWYGIGYGSYVNDRPETRKRVEFYTILYFRGIIEAVPQLGAA
eukprot:CAMPEP_0114252988 /NCGR_PEP_ID=MMETSP0058-20121206/16144_1 /TAXON_ID=36894 /ORGANISM="Pyramimonas parkeae, CCMP726" /LENGTH=393 /DNA_ID=CAMNT_0001366987 /DNA_START=314 /DNA_END=1495 /DNA_ORIENTATION=+